MSERTSGVPTVIFCYVLQQSNRFFMISSKLILMVRFNKTNNSLSLSSSESKSEPNTNKNLIMRLAGLSTWPCLLRTKPSEDIKTRQDKIYFGQTSHKNTSIVKKIEDKRLHLSVQNFLEHHLWQILLTLTISIRKWCQYQNSE